MPVPILLYHHIAPPPPRGTPSRANYVTGENFACQMRWLKRLGFKGISLAQAMPYIDGQKKGKVAVITFDDGFMSVFEAALPILAHYNFTATCFFVAGKISGYNDWDHKKAQRMPLMGAAEIRQFAAMGHEVGSHTLTHPHLTRLETDAARHEIIQSKYELETLSAQPVLSFAYPYGDEHATLRQIVYEAGFTRAVSTRKGRAKAQDNQFALPRHSIRRNDTSLHFLLKCLLR